MSNRILELKAKSYDLILQAEKARSFILQVEKELNKLSLEIEKEESSEQKENQ